MEKELIEVLEEARKKVQDTVDSSYRPMSKEEGDAIELLDTLLYALKHY